MKRRTLAVAACLPILTIGGYVAWALPRESVAMPTASDDPTQVVRTFVRALDQRDFATTNKLAPGTNLGPWWNPKPWHISNLHITKVFAPKNTLTAVEPGYIPRKATTADVETTADFQNWDNGQPDTRDWTWSYKLERANASTPWHIVSWGQG